jgi:hypothetical protein
VEASQKSFECKFAEFMKPAGTEAEVAGNGEGITCFANTPVAATARANGPISYFFQTTTTTTTEKKQFLPTRMNRFASPLDLPTSDGTNSYGLKNLGANLITSLFNSPRTKPSEASSSGSPKNLLTPKTHAQQQELASKRCILSKTTL